MIKPVYVEHYDCFGDAIVFWIDVDNVPDIYINKAKGIDGENYSADCFGCCVTMNEDGMFIVEDNPNCYLFYVDNNGNKNWMQYVPSNDCEKELYKICRKEIMKSMDN